MSDKYEQLKNVVTAEELQELEIRRTAVERLRGMYEKTPLDKVGREWRAAKNELDKDIEELCSKYFPGVQQKYHKNILAAVGWLQEQGYKVKRATVYKAGKAGKLRVEPDGRVSELAVQAYAAGLKKRSTELDLADQGEKSAHKLDEEIKSLKLKNERLEFDLARERGKYILRSDLEMELSSRVMVFEAGLRHFIITRAPALVDACAGDRNLVPAVQIMFNTELDLQLTAMADVERFQVIMVAGEDWERSEVGDQRSEEEEIEAFR